MRIVVALGGNALLRRGEAPEAATQRRRLRPVGHALARLAHEHEVVVVHGNGPQVGVLARESGADPALGRPYPLGDLVAESQGLIGSWLQQALLVEGLAVAALVTQVVVDPADRAFGDPDKPIGVTYDEATARRFAEHRGWTVRPDGNVWRRVVPSPRPLEVLGLEGAARLLGVGQVVVLAGGGGVPLARVAGPDGGSWYEPVEAVVDKDRAAALVADGLGADVLVVLTDVAGVMVGFGTPDEEVIRRTCASELLALDLPAGSMLPKAEACAAFVHGAPGRRAAIGPLEELGPVVAGEAGTLVLP